MASRDLQTLFSVGTLGGLSDGQLLDRFVAQREEAASRRSSGVTARWSGASAAGSSAITTTPRTPSRRPSSSCPEGGFGLPTGDSRQLALRRGLPDGLEGEGDEGEEADAGRPGDGDARARGGARHHRDDLADRWTES